MGPWNTSTDHCCFNCPQTTTCSNADTSETPLQSVNRSQHIPGLGAGSQPAAEKVPVLRRSHRSWRPSLGQCCTQSHCSKWIRSRRYRTCCHQQPYTHARTHAHTRLTTHFQGLPRWAGTRKIKPIWILLKQETVSGSGISWAICKSAPCSRQTPRQHPTTQFFTGRMPFLPPNQQRQSTEGTIVTTWLLLNEDVSWNKQLVIGR